MGAQTDARTEIQTVLAAIQAAWTTYTLIIELDNRDQVDQSTQTNPYLQASISMLSAEQADMGDRPLVEQRGQIVLSVVAKEGTGMAPSTALLDFITPYFDLKAFGLVKCHAVQAYKSKSFKGWEYSPLLINFYFHRLSA